MIDNNTGLVGAGTSGMGSTVKGREVNREECTKQDRRDNAHNLPEMCVLLFFRFSLSWRSRRRKTHLYNSVADDTQCHTPIRATSPICTSPDGAFDSAVIPVRNLSTSRLHSTTTASWFWWPGTTGGSWCYTTRLRRKSMARGLGARFV